MSRLSDDDLHVLRSFAEEGSLTVPIEYESTLLPRLHDAGLLSRRVVEPRNAYYRYEITPEGHAAIEAAECGVCGAGSEANHSSCLRHLAACDAADNAYDCSAARGAS